MERVIRIVQQLCGLLTHRPGQVPSNDRQTLPELYRLGLKRTLPPPVVRRCMSGGTLGYSKGIKQSNSKRPPSYGVPVGPAIMILLSEWNVNETE